MSVAASRLLVACGAIASALASPAFAKAESAARAAPAAPSYADLATLADAATLVVRARVTRQTAVPADRAPGLTAGRTRLYLEAETLALLAGTGTLPGKLVFLADVPLDPKGKPPKLKKQELVLFARTVPGRPDELQLVGPNGHLAWTAALEAPLRAILGELAATNTPPRVTGIRDVLSSAGNLVGESETQIFLATAGGAPASLSVVRRPGQPARWGVSWSELLDEAAAAPARDTLAWYRLACALPEALPAGAQLAEGSADRARAEVDYRLVRESLGPCTRNLR